MKMQNNIFGKSQDYYATMSHVGKRQWPESELKEVPDKKKSSTLELHTPHQSKLRTSSIANYDKNYFSNVL